MPQTGQIQLAFSEVEADEAAGSALGTPGTEAAGAAGTEPAGAAGTEPAGAALGG